MGEEPGAGTGAARIAIVGSSLDANVSKLTVTISKGDGSDFVPIVGVLSWNGADWSAFITGIPAGPGRHFELVAYDSRDNPLSAGSTNRDLAPGTVATVSVVLRPTEGPTPYANAAPVIDALSASGTLVEPGAAVQLGVSAHDPDAGDAVSYWWSASCGTFDDARMPAVGWTAPGAESSCQISITVSDQRGASVVATFEIGVLAAAR